jgi:hypothetical protein
MYELLSGFIARLQKYLGHEQWAVIYHGPTINMKLKGK